VEGLIVVALVLLAIPILGLVGFIMALNLRARTIALEKHIGQLQAAIDQRLASLPQGVAPPEVGAARGAFATAPEAQPDRPFERLLEAPTEEKAEAAEPESVPEPVLEGADAAPEQSTQDAAPPAAPPAARPGFEEQLGTRWAVWGGGLALALGGIFLIKYSIDQGYFGPLARVIMGGLFALALITAGEWFRRREQAQDLAGIPSAYIPGVLTAAGTSTAFATGYGAFALYGLIGAAPAFVLLGIIAVLTMFASALHGPALAALGLVGALINPALVSTNNPQPWALAIYLAVVVFAAYGLARLRLWRWLAVSAAVGTLIWGLLIVFDLGVSAKAAAIFHVIAQTLLAAIFLVADPHRGTPQSAARLDPLASLVLTSFAGLSIFTAVLIGDGGGLALFAAVVVAIQLIIGLAFAPAAVATMLAAILAAAMLAVWPVVSLALGETPAVLPSPAGVPLPEAVSLYVGYAIAAALAILTTALYRLRRTRDLAMDPVGAYAIAATAGPLAILVVAYWRIANFEKSLPFAAAAAALALIFVFAAGVFRKEDDQTSSAIRIGLGGTASAAIAALALGLTFALDKGMLTVAFALAGLGTAWVALSVRIPVLRYVVGVIGLLILGRIAWNPIITTQGELGTTPIFNWLLWGYGVPVVSFWVAAQILARDRRDRITQLCESLAILFAALLFFFEIRHVLNGGDPFTPTSGHLESGLFATVGLGFSIALVQLDGRRPDPVYRIGSLIFGALTLLVSVLGLCLANNPLLDGYEPVEGGAFFNSLLIAYLLPAILAAALSWYARATRPRWYVGAAAGLALVLQFLYMIMEIRRLFKGEDIRLGLSTSEGELWTYSVALIVVGVVLLLYGLMRNNRPARLLSAAYIFAAVFKVFLIDLANLEGIMRALSFIGLGLALLGIGLLYQRLLFRRARPPSSVADASISPS
jgi:uncharacterized membrane protein